MKPRLTRTTPPPVVERYDLVVADLTIGRPGPELQLTCVVVPAADGDPSRLELVDQIAVDAAQIDGSGGQSTLQHRVLVPLLEVTIELPEAEEGEPDRQADDEHMSDQPAGFQEWR